MLFALVILTTISCGASRRDADSKSLEPSEATMVEDSGARLSGDFDLLSEEDDYTSRSPQGEARTTFKFTEDGTFAIERESRSGRSSSEEGTYIISKQGELMLYVEKVGGYPRSDARLTRYLIANQETDSLKLQRNSSSVLTLRKR